MPPVDFNDNGQIYYDNITNIITTQSENALQKAAAGVCPAAALFYHGGLFREHDLFASEHARQNKDAKSGADKV